MRLFDNAKFIVERKIFTFTYRFIYLQNVCHCQVPNRPNRHRYDLINITRVLITMYSANLEFLLYLYLIELCSLGYNWQKTIIGSDNGCYPNRWQTVIWANEDIINWRIFASLGLNEFIFQHICYHTEFIGVYRLYQKIDEKFSCLLERGRGSVGKHTD